MEYTVGFDGYSNVTCNASARPRTITLLSGVSASGQLTCSESERGLRRYSILAPSAGALGRLGGPLPARARCWTGSARAPAGLMTPFAGWSAGPRTHLLTSANH
jgi:hypothetical protein